MNDSRASEVSLTLSPSQWKTVQVLLHSAGQQREDARWKEWAKQVTNAIETAKLEASRSNKEQVSFVLSPSSWKSVQTLLRPGGTLLKKDKLREQKQKIVGAIQAAVDDARQRIVVTTGDLKQSYEVVGPVYFQVSNKGFLSNDLARLTEQYKAEINRMRAKGQIGRERVDWGFLYGEFSAGQSSFERAFFVAVQELKRRAQMLDADAIVGMRQDIDLDTTAFQFFYLQIYGTAVRLS